MYPKPQSPKKQIRNTEAIINMFAKPKLWRYPLVYKQGKYVFEAVLFVSKILWKNTAEGIIYTNESTWQILLILLFG